MEVKSFVDEGEAVDYVAKRLGITYNESEKLYSDLGGYQGYAVNFDTRWPDNKANAFGVCILEFMAEKGLTSLQLQFDS